VVVTRAARQSAELAEAIRQAGGIPILFPLIEVYPPESFEALDAALRAIEEFDWILLTSQNAVAALADRMKSLQLAYWGRRPSVAVVGRMTADAAERAGYHVAYTGTGGTAGELVRELAGQLNGRRVFLPRSDRAAPSLVAQLQSLECAVAEAIAYRTSYLDAVDTAIREQVANADAVIFFSPSAVKAFRKLQASGVISSLRGATAIAAIGPVTRSALAEGGLRCDVEALQPSVSEVVAALSAHFREGNSRDLE
jgi:uroporphyrinogen-III synthase